jgi:glycerol-1-phosphate dehydrogenase [NAD(P)+]
VAKFAARKLNLPWISVPTSLTADGIGSPFAVIDCDDPSLEGPRGNHTFHAFVPLGVVVALGTILPRGGEDQGRFRRMLRSGVGDLLSNLTAALDWELAAGQERDDMDHVACFMARAAAKDLLHDLLGGAALDDAEFVSGVASALLSSGAAMGRARSSRPASGFEHKLYHAFVNRLALPCDATHGEMVAVGTLVSAHLHGRYEEELRAVYRAVGLPSSSAELEALGLSREKLHQAVREAPKVKPERYTILEEAGVEAVLEALDKVYFSHPRAVEGLDSRDSE